MLRYGYFDSEITGYDEEDMPIFDRAESSDFTAMFLSSIISDGVLAQPGDCFQVIAYEGMNLRVRPGFGMIKGRFAVDEQEADIYISQAPRSYKRIDRVILRANYLERLCEIVVREGTPAANPKPPELIRPASGDYYELCLANIAVNANQMVITQANITDTRYDSSVCGVVTNIINRLDTSVLFAQLNQFYNEFVEQANGSYDKFASDMDKYLKELMDNGGSQLAEVVKVLTDFEESSEQQWNEWFDSIRQVLTSVENGKMLETLLGLIKEMYDIATERDIDRIIGDTYIDTDDTGGIFETATEQDIDDIIGETYEDTEDQGDPLIPDMADIVNSAFANA